MKSNSVKTIAAIIWKAYCIIGAVWLTLTIFSFQFFHKSIESTVSGEIIRIERAEWDGYKEVISEIKTDDNKGTVFVKLYNAGFEVGDPVSVKISTSGAGIGYVHAYLHRRTQTDAE
ncbi:hypothetical protein P0Y35_05065 [Kiritimatiellaeota bacterium B1221]|nr:hypothetical protein [Kiritimatiellaeota bacterium B1221]